MNKNTLLNYLDGCGDTEASSNAAALRDDFAKAAMHQFLAGAVVPPGFDAAEQFGMVAARAYEMADAMIKVRAQT